MNSIDWPRIRALFELGSTAYQISKLPGMPSKQAIQNKANKEEWQRQEEGKRILPIVAKALTIDSYKLTDEVLETVLGLIAEGSTIELACSASGIHHETWRKWCLKDERLRDATTRARAGKVSAWLSTVDRATDKDWKAATWLMQNSPDTRQTFGQQHHDNKLEVVINIDRETTVIEST